MLPSTYEGNTSNESGVTGVWTRHRPADLADIDRLYEWVCDVEDRATARAHKWASHGDFIAEYRYVLRSGKHRCFVLETSGRMAAWIEFRGIEPPPGEPMVMLWTSRQFRPGIGVRAACLAMHIAFEELRLERVWWWVAESNTPMLRLCSALGVEPYEGENRGEHGVEVATGEIAFHLTASGYEALPKNRIWNRYCYVPL